MRRKIIEEQLAAIEQAKRQQQERQQSTTASSSSSSSAANPAVTSLPHRNKHAPPPRSSSFSRHSCRTCRPSSRSRNLQQHSAALARARALARIPSSLASRHPSAPRRDPIHFSPLLSSRQPPRHLHLALPLALPHPPQRRAMPQHSPSALPTPNLPTPPSSRLATLLHHHHSATITLSTIRPSPLPPHHAPNRSVNRTPTTTTCSQAPCTPSIRTIQP